MVRRAEVRLGIATRRAEGLVAAALRKLLAGKLI
jgi:hypothetical protein